MLARLIVFADRPSLVAICVFCCPFVFFDDTCVCAFFLIGFADRPPLVVICVGS